MWTVGTLQTSFDFMTVGAGESWVVILLFFMSLIGSTSVFRGVFGIVFRDAEVKFHM